MTSRQAGTQDLGPYFPEMDQDTEWDDTYDSADVDEEVYPGSDFEEK